MSILWRKFRKTGGGEGSPNHAGRVEDGGAVAQSPSHRGAVSNRGLEPVISSPRQESPAVRHFITETDEKLFLSDSGDDREDPLMVESQFVKTVADIFSSHSTLPYFLQFLQGWGSEKYAKFWLDVVSFKSSAETHIRTNDTESVEESLVMSERGNAKNSKTSDTQNVVNSGQTDLQGMTLINSTKEEVKSQSKGLVLPDLVSNIRATTDVTPLNSPDGPSRIQNCDSPISQKTNEEISSNISAVGHRDENCVQNCDSPIPQKTKKPIPPNIIDSGQRDGSKDVEVSKGNKALDSSVKDNSGIINSDSLTLCRAQKLRQSIADDAMRIFQKYLAFDAEHSIVVDNITREGVFQKLQVSNQDIDPECFDSAQAIVFSMMEKEFLPKFLASDYYLKHQIDVLTSGSVRLADILYSDSALPYFMEYVEQEGGRSMLQFWVAASNFRQQLLQDGETCDPMDAQSDAMVLYDKYFSLQATCPLGFSDSVRFVVESNICCEEGPSYFCFDVPLRVVLFVLEKEFLTGYLSSSLHIKYLSELINTVKTSVELLGRKKRSGSESTCSSEQSSSQGISSHNTLLAMDSSAPHRFRNLDDPTLAMRIDEAQITDPDSLWRRKNFSRMSCGFINELGRFESDLQPEPDRKTESKLSRTLKKFVNMDENKVKEDMAYKVAEMIIKDVTNVTLGSQQSSARSSVESSVPPLSPSAASQDNLSDVFPT